MDIHKKEVTNYSLMHKDIKVADIELDQFDGSISRIASIYNPRHLPPRAKKSVIDFRQWWRDRAIPKSRKELKEFLESRGIENTENYLMDNLGLSLNDCYWIRPNGIELRWEDANLFSNSFQNSMISKRSAIGSKDISSFSFSPDASTGGDLPKWWIMDNGVRYLVKGNEGGTSQQSRNEVLASIIHQSQEFSNHVDYDLVHISDGRIGCRSELFTSENAEFISAWELIGRHDYSKNEPFRDNFIKACIDGGIGKDEVIYHLDYMALTDFIMSNYDRHLNNFGVLRDPDSLRIIGMAPLFDTGNSMLYKNPLNISMRVSLEEKTHGLYSSYKSSIEHINNLRCVNIDTMPKRAKVESLYEGDILHESVPRKLGRLYEEKLKFVSELQRGCKFYDLQKRYDKSSSIDMFPTR